MIELLLFGSFFVFLLLGVPVAFSLGASAVVVLLTTDGLQVLDVVPGVMFPSLSSGTLLAIPFFVLAGAVMQHTGISQRLVDLAYMLFGRFSFGLAAVTIVAAFFFSAISGSGPATVAAIGAILIPALVRNGYKREHATSLVAASGSMGIVVPPSIAFIIFAVVAAEYQRVSISRLFIAGIVPGVLMAVAFFVAAMMVPRVRQVAVATVRGRAQSEGTPSILDDEHRASAKDIGLAFVRAIPGLLIPVIIMGGIYGGIFTPTEAGAVASVYALVVGLLVYRDLPLKRLPAVMLEAGVSTATIMFIVGLASLFSYVITVEGVASRVSEAVLSVTDNRVIVLLIAVVILLVVGAFVDAVSAFYLFVPILVPVLLAVGVDITTIGVFMTVALAIGLFTPPVGLNLFVATGISGARLSETIRGVVPFLLAAIVVLLLITFVPALSNGLPDLLGVQ
ncbi:TRAP transporter large permease [Brevibacterium samyangense]|uniref:TRAP C4-dicarboxylate transport system permease DctM subunit domain-containing protein n=1 Tax=Brevibacterium samyangense TaxID=366888 RepID=A0ABP5EXE2_9MICO